MQKIRKICELWEKDATNEWNNQQHRIHITFHQRVQFKVILHELLYFVNFSMESDSYFQFS